VIIIGAGIMGLSLACELAARGRRAIVIIDKSAAGSGASTVNAGIVSASYSYDSAVVDLSKAAVEKYQKLRFFLGTGPVLHPCGLLRLAQDEAQFSRLVKLHHILAEKGIKTQMMDREEIIESFAYVDSMHSVGGLFCSSDGQGDPRDVISAYLEKALNLGVTVLENTRVNRIVIGKNAKTIVTDKGEMECKVVALCAGFFSKALAQSAGIVLPLQFDKRELLVSRQTRKILSSDIVNSGTGVYALQKKNGAIVCGGVSSEEISSPDDLQPTQRFTEVVLSQAFKLVPELSRVEFIDHLVSHRDKTPDNAPIVGQSSSVEGLVFANGTNGHGFTLGPILGELLAKLILNGKTSPLIQPFGPSRFSR